MSADTELFLIDENVLSGRVIPTISDFLDRGDSTAAKELVRKAISSQQFQTTHRSTVTGDRVTAEYLANGSKEVLEGRFTKEILDDTGKMIRDREAIRRRQTGKILFWFFASVLALGAGAKLVLP